MEEVPRRTSLVPLAFPLFYALFNRGGNRRAFRLPGAGGGSFPLYGGTFARSYSVLISGFDPFLLCASLQVTKVIGHSGARGSSSKGYCLPEVLSGLDMGMREFMCGWGVAHDRGEGRTDNHPPTKCSKSRDLIAIAICDSNRESQITSDLRQCEPSQKSSLF